MRVTSIGCRLLSCFGLALVFFFFAACGAPSGEKESSIKGLTTLTEADLNKPLPEAQRKKVFVLHSYHAEYQWLKDVNRGIDKGLAEERFVTGKNISLEYLYMDTKRKTSKEWFEQISQQALRKIREMKPDVVIATDDNAQKYVVSQMVDSGINFVFLGVNAAPEAYGIIDNWEKPGHNVTGCVERERFEQTIRVLREMAPNVSRLAVVCDDGPTGVPIIKRVTELAPTLGVQIVACKQIGKFSQWKRYVHEVQDMADALLVIVYHTVKDDNGNHVSADEVLNWTVTNSHLPDIGFWDWAVEGGLLCSEAISGYQQGYYAGTLAAYILQGQKPAEFAIGKPRRGETCINLARAQMLHIKVPPDLMKSATMYKEIQSGNPSK